jgi:2-polyprenyl-6-methoxyphenol hydroxylase-like FAD-dependent oxidoreductase
MRVLISGAGIAGSTLAWYLAKTKAHITVLEKSPTLLPHGQNVDLQGSAVTVIEKMGLLEQVRQANTREIGTQFIDSKGTPFATFPVTEGSTVSLTSEYEILRGDLAKILYTATKDFPNIKYVFGTTIDEVVSNSEDGVTVRLSDGKVRDFDLLVAADGQWSKVRKQCFPLDQVKAVDTGMYSVYYTVPRMPHDNDWWNIYVALKSRIITTRPDPYGTIRAMFTIMPSAKAQDAAWKEAGRSDRTTQEKLLREEFADAGWEAERLLDAIHKTPDFYFHVIHQIKMTKWYSSRIVCLGDTAYAPSPLTGMGTSLAIIGAHVLAGELSNLEDGESPLKALEAYEKTLRHFVEESQKIPPFFPAIAHPGSAWKRWLLQGFVGIVSRAVATSWIASRIGQKSDYDKFPLPEYACFGEKV